MIPSDYEGAQRVTVPVQNGLGMPDLTGLPLYYRNAIANDPILRAQLLALSTQGTGNLAGLRGTRSSLLAQFGEIPTGVGFTVDALTRALARQATQSGVSTVAGLQRTANQNRANDVAALAARGVIHSGALGTHLAGDAQAATQAQYDERMKLLGHLQDAQSTYLTSQQGLRGQVATDTGSALTRQIANIKAGLVPGAAPTPTSTPATPKITVAAPRPGPMGYKPLP